MMTLTDNQKKLLFFQLFIAIAIVLASITGKGATASLVLVVAAFSLLPIEKLKNPVWVFVLSYLVGLVGLIAARLLFYMYWG